MAIFQLTWKYVNVLITSTIVVVVYHLNIIGPGSSTTEEPITCLHEVLWKGLDVSQDLGLVITAILRSRSNNIFVYIGRNRNIHRSSAA